jgi:hypothetical protein
MSIVLILLAGFFGFLFLRGLYKRIKLVRECKLMIKAIKANPHLQDSEKQEVIDYINNYLVTDEL